jgi:hypothetical protein
MKGKILRYLFCVLFFISFSSYGQEIVHDPIQTAAVLGSLSAQLEQLKEAVKSLTSFNWNNADNATQLQNLRVLNIDTFKFFLPLGEIFRCAKIFLNTY